MKKNNKQYDWVLFDVDKTLFHFDAFSGLQRMFSQFGADFTREHYQDYQTLNVDLWKQYGEGLISASELRNRRFMVWSDKVGQSTEVLSEAFLNAMADLSLPLDGAMDLIDSLRGEFQLGIITNGFAEFLTKRLEKHGLHDHFDVVVSSDVAGVAKPHPDIFHYAARLMQQPLSERVLMVGDTLETDILGGHHAGVHTCWLNPSHEVQSDDIVPHYQVQSLSEIKSILT